LAARTHLASFRFERARVVCPLLGPVEPELELVCGIQVIWTRLM
jgi:hypothetical protein